MPDSPKPRSSLSPEIAAYYERGDEVSRLSQGPERLEFVRTQEIIQRYLPPPPAVILDVGGGSGVYARWLACQGYEVHLIDASPYLVEQARLAEQENPAHPLAGIAVGDARQLDCPDASIDAILLLGPLYHLTEREDRIATLCEAGRVLKDQGVAFAVGISRFTSALHGLFYGFLDDPEFSRIVERDLIDGQHRNPNNRPHYFTTAYFHHPAEMEAEIEEAGLIHTETLSIEGPGWLLQDFETHWGDDGRREHLLSIVRALESEPSVLGLSVHIMAVARKGKV